MIGGPITPLELSMPTLKSLLFFQVTVDTSAIDNKEEELMKEIEDKDVTKCQDQEQSVECDNIFMKQPPTASELRVGTHIYYLFNYADDRNEEDLLMWIQSCVTKTSNGKCITK